MWAAPDWINTETLEENVARCVPALRLFCDHVVAEQLDGFVVRICGREHATDVVAFGHAVRRALSTLSAASRGDDCMKKSYIGGRGWVRGRRSDERK